MTEEQQQVPKNRQEVLTLSEAVLQVPDWAGMQAISAQAMDWAGMQAISAQAMALSKQFKAIDFAALIGPIKSQTMSADLVAEAMRSMSADLVAEAMRPMSSAAMMLNSNLFAGWAAKIEPRRSAPIHLPAMPAPEPTVQAVQSGEAEVLDQLDQMLHQGQIEPGRIAALLSKHTSKQPGPSTEGEWTEARVLNMWAEWQSHSGNGEIFAQERWNISKGYMYKLFRINGLARKRGH